MSENNQNKVPEHGHGQKQSLPTTPEMLYAYLDDIGVSYEVYRHEPVFTVEESAPLKAQIPGGHCRNLYMRDKKKRNYLLVALNETDVDLKKLPDLIGAGRLSFGSADRLWEFLGVRPGSVCPFSIINDTNHQVEIFLDQAMMECDLVNYHPMMNHLTVGLTPADLVKFIESTGHTAHIVDLKPAAPDTI
jgi:Ala-tRNA(Pro) deacylase